MIKAAHVKSVKNVQDRVAKAAQESARQCQKLSAAFRGVMSVTVMHRRALNRLEFVRDRFATLAANLLNLLRVNQMLSMQMDASGSRPHELSHFWLHGSSPYNP